MPSAICDNTFFSVLIVLNLTERYYTAFLYVTTMGFWKMLKEHCYNKFTWIIIIDIGLVWIEVSIDDRSIILHFSKCVGNAIVSGPSMLHLPKQVH